MISLSAVTAVFSAAILVTTLVLVSRMRLPSLVALFRTQSFFLALFALAIGYLEKEPHLILIGALILMVKVLLIPEFLLYIARQGNISQRLTAYARPTLMTFCALVMAGLAFIAAGRYFPGGDQVALGTSFSLLLCGVLLLVSRADMFGQAIGFLVMESGIFILGFAMTGGMPLLVEIGILLDLMVFFVLVLLLTRRAQAEHASLLTEHLRELID